MAASRVLGPPSPISFIFERRIGVEFGVRRIDSLGPVFFGAVAAPLLGTRSPRDRRRRPADLPRTHPRWVPIATRFEDPFNDVVLGRASVSPPWPPLRHDRSDPVEAHSPGVHAGEEMAATTRMRSPQEEHSSGSQSQVRAMRRAQLRLRFRTNLRSSSRVGRRVGVVVVGVGGEGGSDGEGEAVPSGEAAGGPGASRSSRPSRTSPGRSWVTSMDRPLTARGTIPSNPGEDNGVVSAREMRAEKEGSEGRG